MNFIDDWFDAFLLCGLTFLIVILGVWALPQLPEHTHFYVAISIMLSGIFFCRKIICYIEEKINSRKHKKEKKQ